MQSLTFPARCGRAVTLACERKGAFLLRFVLFAMALSGLENWALAQSGSEVEALGTRVMESVKSGRFKEAAVLNEFRDAVDLIRCTSWAVQQWIGLKEKGDPYTVLPILAEQRVKRATQLLKDLTIDLESVEVGFQTPGLKELNQAVTTLQERLAPLCQR